MNALTQELVELLTLEKLEENIYRGISRNLMAKALSAVKFGQFSMDELFSRQWCLLLTLKKA